MLEKPKCFFRINFKKVDLPLPFLPINPTFSRWLMIKFPSEKIALPEKEIDKFFALIIFNCFKSYMDYHFINLIIN